MRVQHQPAAAGVVVVGRRGLGRVHRVVRLRVARRHLLVVRVAGRRRGRPQPAAVPVKLNWFDPGIIFLHAKINCFQIKLG